MEYPTRLSLYYSPNMEPGGFAYTTVERIEIHEIVVVVVVFFSTLWYSGGSILSCLSLYSVFAIWEQPHSM